MSLRLDHPNILFLFAYGTKQTLSFTAQGEWMNIKNVITIDPIRAMSNDERSWFVLLSKNEMSPFLL